MVLDDSTSGLDAFVRMEMTNLIRELKREGKTILLNSRILEDVEMVADKAIILKEGMKLAEVDLQNKLGNMNLQQMFIQAIGGMTNASHCDEYL